MMPRLTRILLHRRTVLILTLLGISSLVLFHQLGAPGPPRVRQSVRRQWDGRRRQEEYTDRRGIRVIVGHYKEDEGPAPNYTKAELNLNR